MRRGSLFSFVAACALALWAVAPTQSAPWLVERTSTAPQAEVLGPSAPPPPVPLGTSFTYQGQLRRGGAPHNGKCDFKFELWEQATGGSQIGATHTITDVPVVNGLFTVQLDFGDAYSYETRYLKIEVKCAGEASYTALAPRQRVAPAPLALALPGVHTPQLTDTLGMLAVNVIGGRRNNTVSGPGNYFDNVIAGGLNNTIVDDSIQNAIGGGISNTIDISTDSSAIGGGQSNRIDGSDKGAIGGGTANRISKFSSNSAIGGGEANAIANASDYNVIGGGQSNAIREDSTHNVIGGGWSNAISTTSRLNFIGAGEGNSIENVNGAAAIAAGHTNRIADLSVDSFIGAGMNNRMKSDADFGAIGAGIANVMAADATANFIGAGESNRIVTMTHRNAIGGGAGNTISDRSSDNVIGGGRSNTITLLSDANVIGGGDNNRIVDQADYSAIPGGQDNQVAADWALAAGRGAQALHNGAFVWADSQAAPVASTGPDEFVIRAQGGLRMPGAGLNTLTSMFIHPFTPCPNGTVWATPVMNPLVAGRPGAILVVTPQTAAPILGGPPAIGPMAVMFDGAGQVCGIPGTWVIYNMYAGPLNPNVNYNVFVVNP